MAKTETDIQWEQASFDWTEESSTYINLVWGEVFDIMIHGRSWSNWKKKDKNKKKQKQVIRLLMWKKGIKIYDENKEVEKIDLYLDDIKIIAEEIKTNVQIIHG
tara:strand:- start:596 stop:907 length:312 start_codon:yes stop_codon:yes gene_type:complete